MPRKRRDRGKPARYEPQETLRSRATEGHKRSRRRSPKSCSASKMLRYLQRTQEDNDDDLPFLDSDDERSDSDSCDEEEHDQQPWRRVQNVVKDQIEVMKKAAQAKIDFPNDIKVEYPRYRCNCCHQYFKLANYRKVCCNNCRKYCKWRAREFACNNRHKYCKLQAHNTGVCAGQFQDALSQR